MDKWMFFFLLLLRWVELESEWPVLLITSTRIHIQDHECADSFVVMVTVSHTDNSFVVMVT